MPKGSKKPAAKPNAFKAPVREVRGPAPESRTRKVRSY